MELMNPRSSVAYGEFDWVTVELDGGWAAAEGSDSVVHDFLATSLTNAKVATTAPIPANTESVDITRDRKPATESVLHAIECCGQETAIASWIPRAECAFDHEFDTTWR
ncbi:MAG TPA: hypothetical protein VF874_22190 [Mycobacterium sp.]